MITPTIQRKLDTYYWAVWEEVPSYIRRVFEIESTIKHYKWRLNHQFHRRKTKKRIKELIKFAEHVQQNHLRKYMRMKGISSITWRIMAIKNGGLALTFGQFSEEILIESFIDSAERQDYAFYK